MAKIKLRLTKPNEHARDLLNLICAEHLNEIVVGLEPPKRGLND